MNGLDLTYDLWKYHKKHIANADSSFLFANPYFFPFYFYSPSILARGVTPSLLAAVAVIITRAQAPSFSVLALAAVTVPT